MSSLIAFDVIDLPLLHIKTGIKQIIKKNRSKREPYNEKCLVGEKKYYHKETLLKHTDKSFTSPKHYKSKKYLNMLYLLHQTHHQIHLTLILH